MIRMRRGQTILEYTIIVGIVVVVLTFMGTAIKRGVQSMVKVTADQVGNQQNSDQDFNDVEQGYMLASNTTMKEYKNKQVTASGYIPVSGNAVYGSNIFVNEYSDTISNTITSTVFAVQ